MAEPDRKPLSTLGRGSDWVNLWRKRDGEWVSFVGRIADDGAVEYQSGAERSIHNTVTHWSPLIPAPEPTNDAVSDERLREIAKRLRQWADVLEIPSGDFVNDDLRAAADELNRRSVTSQASEGEVEGLIEGLRQIGNAGHNPALTGAQHEALMRAINFLHRAPVSKRVERLETALKPFADAAADLPEHIHDMVPVVLTTDAEDNPVDIVHIGDFRRALQALGDRS
jgi:hypothetical protein